jgi:outer membrane usher protein
MAYTNKRGKALIPRLASYQNNAVQLDPGALPITAGIESLEQIVVPSYRSAVKITFPVRTGRGALVRVMLDDGEPAPLGALVNIEGETETFFVARRGEAFVTGLQDTTPMILNLHGQTCSFEVKLPAEETQEPKETEEIPRVGPFLCAGVKR